MSFSQTDKLKALAIVHTFETSRPFGDYAACVVLDDGAGVSYGVNQFTHRSGSLAAVVEAYLENGGVIGREILQRLLPVLRSKTGSSINRLATSEVFKKALKAAAVTSEMKEAQNAVAFEKYLFPAIRICETRGFTLPLSLAVVYDSVTHGSWEYISARVDRFRRFEEKEWIAEYVHKRQAWLTGIRRLRVTSYRTRFFLEQIRLANWNLKLPIMVHSVRLTERMFQGPEGSKSDAFTRSDSDETGRGRREETAEAVTLTKPFLESAGETLRSAARRFDQVDGVVTAVTTRRDAAKSLWTTILGTVWQTAWAVFGFVVGLPVEVWVVVAVIVAILMLGFLYRQIVLGKVREALYREERTTPSAEAAATPPL